MTHKHTGMLWILILSLFLGTVLTGCKVEDTDGSFVYNGKTFAYISGGNTEMRWVTLNAASMQELLTILEECDISGNEGDKPVPTAEQALVCGVSVLEQSYDLWTVENRVVVQFNDTANVWIVHGQYQDRVSAGQAGVVAIDPDTGRAVAIGLIRKRAVQ